MAEYTLRLDLPFDDLAQLIKHNILFSLHPPNVSINKIVINPIPVFQDQLRIVYEVKDA